MSVLLALENALHNRIRYAIGSNAVVLRMAEDFLASGIVAENVNVVVRFTGSNVNTPNAGANIPTVRAKTVNFEVELIYKNTQRHGHSFALAMLDAISCQVTGFTPDLSPILGINSLPHPLYQTGFELQSENFAELSPGSQYAYKQLYSIQVLQPQGQISALPCPIEFNKLTLKDCLPCKRCLKTKTTSINLGLAEWQNPATNERFFVYDIDECPPRPQDKIDITLGTQLEDNIYEATLVYTPAEAITHDPVNGIQIDAGQQVTSTLDRFYSNPQGVNTLPNFCRNFQVIFDVYATNDGKASFLDENSFFLRQFSEVIEEQPQG